MALNNYCALGVLVQKDREFVEVARGATLERRPAGFKQHVAKCHYQAALGGSSVQLRNLPLQVLGLVLCKFRVHARGLGLTASCVRVGTCGSGLALRELRVTACDSGLALCELRVTACGSCLALCELRVTACGSRIAAGYVGFARSSVEPGGLTLLAQRLALVHSKAALRLWPRRSD